MKDKAILWLVIISFSGGLAAVCTDLLINYDPVLDSIPKITFFTLWALIAFVFWLGEGFISER